MATPYEGRTNNSKKNELKDSLEEATARRNGDANKSGMDYRYPNTDPSFSEIVELKK